MMMNGLCFQTYGGVDTSVIVDSYSVSPQTAYKGDTVALTLTIKNNSGANLDYIYLNLDDSKGSSFYLKNGDPTMKLCGAIGDGTGISRTISLSYDGGLNKRVYFQLVYKPSGGTETSIDKSLGINAVATSEIPTPTVVDTKKYMPKLNILTSDIPTVIAGNSISVAIPIKNTNNQAAKDITVTPSVDGSDGNLLLDDLNGSRDIATINANGTETVVFKIRSLQSAVSKVYPIKINLDYSNLFGDSFSTQSVVNVKVIGVNSDIAITGLEEDKSVIDQGDKANITVTVKNTGTSVLKDVRLVLSGYKEDSLILEGGNTKRLAAELLQGQEIKTSIGVKSSKNAAEGNNTINVKISGKDVNDKVVSDDQSINLAINQLKKSSNIDVSEVSANPIKAVPGGKVYFEIGVKNTGDNDLKDVKITLNNFKDDVISIDDNTNRKLIPYLPAGQENKMMYILDIGKKAIEGNYLLTAKVEGRDSGDHTVNDEQNCYLAVDSNVQQSDIQITGISVDNKAVQPGETTNVEATVRNTGGTVLKNIKLSLSGTKEDGFLTSNGGRNLFMTLAPGQEVKSTFSLIAAKKAAEGNYSMSIKVDGKDEDNKSVGDEQSFYTSISKAEDKEAFVDFEDISIPHGTLVKNSNYNIGFSIVNLGDTSIRNIKTSITADPILIMKTPSFKLIKNLMPKKKIPFIYRLMTPQKLSDKTYPIQINVEYEALNNGQWGKQTIGQTLSLYSENPSGVENTKTVPKIIIDKYAVYPVMPVAGTTIKLKASFLNTNAAKPVRNIKIYLSSADSNGQTDSGNVFVPVNSSNTFFIDGIKPKQSVSKELSLYIVNDAKPRTYSLAANFEYEDDKGTEYKATEIIGIPVRPQAKLDTSDISLPGEVSITDPISISFDLYNTGKSLLRNVMIKSIGNFTVQSQNSFIGNLDSGNQDHYEAQIVPKKTGKLSGFVIISFEDAAGELQTLKKEITSNVISPPPAVNPMTQTPADQSEKKTFPIYLELLFGIIVVALVFGAFFVHKRRRRKKLEEMMFDE